VNEAQVRGELDKLSKAAQKGGTQSRVNLASQVRGLTPTSMEKEENASLVAERRKKQERRKRNEAMDLKDDIEEASRRNRAAALWRQRAAKREAAASSDANLEAFHRKKVLTAFLGGFSVGGANLGAFTALTKLSPAVAAVTAGLGTFRFVLNTTMQAAERSKQLYSKATLSGFGLQGQAKRTLISEALGVNENEIYRFGKAFTFLNENLDFASKTMAENAPNLTEVSLRLSVLKNNFEAFGSVLANQVAPILNSVLEDISKNVKNMAQQWQTESKRWASVNSFVSQYQGMSVHRDLEKGQALGEMPSKYTFLKNGKELQGKELENIVSKFEKFSSGFDTSKKKGSSMLGEPAAFMKQLPASSWEKMGLVIGGGGKANYAEQTAKNTEKTVAHLGKLVQAIMNPKQAGQRAFGQAIPSIP
jgi:hypothetical protein